MVRRFFFFGTNYNVMYLILGDSNHRLVYETFGEQLSEAAESEVVFEQCTNNESLRIALEQVRDPKPIVTYIGANLNEIAAKVGKGKPREDVIKAVTSELNDNVNRVATEIANTSRLYLIANPFLRQDPKWIEDKLILISYYTTQHINAYSPSNVANVSEPQITADDLGSDKVHLNDKGKKKVAEKIIIDFKIAKDEVRKFRECGMEWDDVERLSQKTPRTNNKKRARSNREEEKATEPTATKRVRNEDEDDSVKGMLKTFMDEIREDRMLSQGKMKAIESELALFKESEIKTQQQLEELKQGISNDNFFSATIREDLDSTENENLRNTVIVKKLKVDGPMPKERIDLQKMAQQEGRKMVKEILGNDSSVAYIAMLYSGKEGIRVNEGFLPPFKIVFKTKQEGIEFKEKAVRKSKEGGNRLAKTYFSTQQTPATRVRTILMWSIADKLKDPAKGIEAWVTQNMNKPALQVKGEERFQRGYTFVNAMQKYGNKIDVKSKEEALKVAKRFFQGQVEKVFIVIKD